MKIGVKVIPNSKVEEVIMSDGKYLVKVKQPPREGKANRAVMKLLAHYFKVPQVAIRVVSGLGSKDKIIEIRGR
jgi:uncharacterized protein (TIGR00251 family)